MPDSPTVLTALALAELGLPAPAKIIGHGRPQDKLARLFRTQTREILVQEKIRYLIEQRVIQELTGAQDIKLLPTLMKIAAGRPYTGVKDLRQGQGAGGQSWQPGTEIHFHLNKLTDKELEDFAKEGIRPEAMKSLPAHIQEDAPDE